ncbi:MAG TPA: DUF2795 domain-containing protein [Actinomycetota bacterium]|nr:DUF2795 domain-containing protein [Actinomycetota bacterium]
MTERGSDKVNPRVDEELQRETDSLERGAPAPSRAEEHRQAEAPADGEPAPDVRPDIEDAEGRTELARHLRPSSFPADRDTLLATARDENAPETVVRLLEQLPDQRQFETPQDVWDAVREASGR